VLDQTGDSSLDFVELAYPWGEPRELAGFAAPDHRQREFLKDLGDQVTGLLPRKRPFDLVPAFLYFIASLLMKDSVLCYSHKVQN